MYLPQPFMPARRLSFALRHKRWSLRNLARRAEQACERFVRGWAFKITFVPELSLASCALAFLTGSERAGTKQTRTCLLAISSHVPGICCSVPACYQGWSKLLIHCQCTFLLPEEQISPHLYYLMEKRALTYTHKKTKQNIIIFRFSVESNPGLLLFCFSSHCDWSRKLASLSQPVRLRLKTITTWALAFSRATSCLLVYILSSHWFPAIIPFPMIGCCITSVLALKQLIEIFLLYWAPNKISL